MAQIVQIGKKSTIIEGTEAEINEIRQKLHELGFNFENYQYIELQVQQPQAKNNQEPKSINPTASVNQATASQSTSSQNNVASQQASSPKPAAVPKQVPAQNSSSESQPTSSPKPAAAPKQTPAQNSSSASQQPTTNSAPASQTTEGSRFPYKINKTDDGYEILIPQSKMDKVLSLFPIVRKVQKKRVSMKNPENENSNYFFTLKQPYVQFTVYPVEPITDHMIETALKLLSLI